MCTCVNANHRVRTPRLGGDVFLAKAYGVARGLMYVNASDKFSPTIAHPGMQGAGVLRR